MQSSMLYHLCWPSKWTHSVIMKDWVCFFISGDYCSLTPTPTAEPHSRVSQPCSKNIKLFLLSRSVMSSLSQLLNTLFKILLGCFAKHEMCFEWQCFVSLLLCRGQNCLGYRSGRTISHLLHVDDIKLEYQTRVVEHFFMSVR